MINKEEIEKAKDYLKNYKYQNEVSDAIDIVLQYISELEEDNKRQKEINEEHQKLNGELIKENKKLKEILTGKSIQELGISDLYKED